MQPVDARENAQALRRYGAGGGVLNRCLVVVFEDAPKLPYGGEFFVVARADDPSNGEICVAGVRLPRGGVPQVNVGGVFPAVAFGGFVA